MGIYVNNKQFFHVARTVPYNSYDDFERGMELEVGKRHNPFFSFYQKAKTFPVNIDNEMIDVKAISFLARVKNGEITPHNLANDAHDVAQHYLMLARELIMEEVRKDTADDSPSRQSCLWAVETKDQALFWKNRLGCDDARLVTLAVDGVTHTADAGLLLGDSEPLEETYKRAKAYWRGEMSENPELEVLLNGRVEVVDVVDF